MSSVRVFDLVRLSDSEGGRGSEYHIFCFVLFPEHQQNRQTALLIQPDFLVLNGKGCQPRRQMLSYIVLLRKGRRKGRMIPCLLDPGKVGGLFPISAMKVSTGIIFECCLEEGHQGRRGARPMRISRGATCVSHQALSVRPSLVCASLPGQACRCNWPGERDSVPLFSENKERIP